MQIAMDKLEKLSLIARNEFELCMLDSMCLLYFTYECTNCDIEGFDKPFE